MIVIAGSAANPPHAAHAAFVRSLIHDDRVTHVWWKVDPDRHDKQMEAARVHRTQMTERLFRSFLSDEEFCSVTVNPLVLEHAVPTIALMEAATRQYPDEQFAWAAGADHFELEDGKTYVERQWIRGVELILTYPYFVIPRIGYSDPDVSILPGLGYLLDEFLPMEMSSTEIRKMLRRGRTDIPYLPEPVLSYINHHHLYQE